MAGTIVTRSQVSTLISTALDEVFNTRGEEVAKIYPQYTKVVDMKRGQYISYDVAGVGKHEKLSEMEQREFNQPEFGTTRTATPETWGTGVKVSREALDDLAANPYGDFSQAKFNSLKAYGAQLKDSADQTIEDLCAQFVLSGNSATATSTWIGAGRDGVALASASHVVKKTGASASNLSSASSLSSLAIQSALTSLETTPSDEGFYRAIPKSVIVVVGPYNRHRVYELEKTQGQVDSANNNVNVLNGFNIKYIVNPHLGSSFKGFMMIDPSQAKLYALMRQKPMIESWEDKDIRGMKIASTFRFRADFLDWHGVQYNAGA